MGEEVCAHCCEHQGGTLHGDDAGCLIESEVGFGAVMGNEGVDGIDGQRTDDTAHHDGEAEGEHVTAKGEGGAP